MYKYTCAINYHFKIKLVVFRFVDEFLTIGAHIPGKKDVCKT